MAGLKSTVDVVHVEGQGNRQEFRAGMVSFVTDNRREVKKRAG